MDFKKKSARGFISLSRYAPKAKDEIPDQVRNDKTEFLK